MSMKKEINGQPLSVIFDDTSRMGEALAIVIKFVRDGWQIQQRLICLQLITKSMCGDNLNLQEN